MQQALHVDTSGQVNQVAGRPSPLLEERKAGALAPPRRTVLIVDDEPIMRTVVARMLSRLGFAVMEVNNGVEGVEAIRKRAGAVSCVLCDVVMPGMDGWETLTAMRALAPALPVVMMTGFFASDHVKTEAPPAPHVFLRKPFGLAALRDAVDGALTVCLDELPVGWP